MTLATTIRVLQVDASTKEVFDKMREIIRIPEDHPYEDDEGCLTSQPGDFMSYLCVGGENSLSEEDVDHLTEACFSIGPTKWLMEIDLDTSYGARVLGVGSSASAIHNYIIARMSSAFPDMVFATHNEFNDTWHYNELPYK